MALILHPRNATPHIAEEDILCDKIVYRRRGSNFIKSAYRNYLCFNVKYHISVTLTAKITPFDRPWTTNTRAIVICEGIHAKVHNPNREKSKSRTGVLTTKAIIPKGTVYYTDGNAIVAEKMIIYNPFKVKP